MNSPIFCNHANEVPYECTCQEGCYCKSNTCVAGGDVDKWRKDLRTQFTTDTERDPRKILLDLIDEVMDSATKPLEIEIERLCKNLGHKFIDDQCGRSDHKYCAFCTVKEFPNAHECK